MIRHAAQPGRNRRNPMIRMLNEAGPVRLGEFNRDLLVEHVLYATGTTGSVLEQELDLQIHKLESGPLGGDRGLLSGQEPVAVPQIVVYNPSHKRIRNPIAHWLRSDGRTLCGRNLKRSVGWEPHDGSPYRMCGRCMWSAGGATKEISGGSAAGGRE